MKSLNFIYILLLSTLIVWFACDKNPSAPEYQKEIAIYGYLWGNEPLDAERAILISWSQPISSYYDLNKAAISNAKVSLRDMTNDIEYSLEDAPERPGFYFNDMLIIHPKTIYKLTVEVEEKVITATTTVPPELKLTTKLLPDTVNIEKRDDLGIRKPIFLDCEDVDRLVVVDMFCNEAYENAEYINPFADNHKFPDTQEEYDGGKNAEPRHIMAFAKCKEFGTDLYQGEPVIFWYHSMIVFYGSNTLQVMAIDDNYHRFLYSEHPELNGGILGGIGVFGSLMGERYELRIVK